MEWTKEKVIQKMEELRGKGFIRVPADMFRKDDGIVGQILEREFRVSFCGGVYPELAKKHL